MEIKKLQFVIGYLVLEGNFFYRLLE